MSGHSYRRFLAAALIAVTGTAMVAASFDAEARRVGGGSSIGRQSPNVTMQRQATTPPAATGANAGASSAAAPAAGAATAGAAAGAATRGGASRWLGPIAGIAAGLGLAALLSHLGLSGAFAEMLSSLLLIALVAFAVLFIIRRLRGAGPRPAMQGAYGMARQADEPARQAPAWRQALPAAGAAGAAGAAAATPAAAQVGAAPAAVPRADADGNWFVPGDFDTQGFLKQAKEQFVRIQGVWDSGDTDRLREYLTDDLIVELKPQLMERKGAANHTEVVLLNAELLGIEAVSDGHLASVRFSGMLREEPGAEAFRFEEVWNLFKPTQGGWLLAGIQQIPVQYAS
ncbi:Tim44-like domain-containing protein [Bordetella sputigena]|uniref:Tim44 domain-containing protein n=1 Tax=Bordetella sputigena TaxID=1416810 RepID=UPI0039EFA1ED